MIPSSKVKSEYVYVVSEIFSGLRTFLVYSGYRIFIN